MEFNKKINNSIEIKLLQEQDTRKVIEFINKYKINNKINISNDIYINDQLLNSEEYNEVNIRANIYEYYEEFMSIEIDNQIKLLVAMSINKNNKSKALNLNLICGDNSYLIYLKDLIDFAEEVLSEYCIIEPTKIVTNLLNNNQYYSKWYDVLIKGGFIILKIRENEKGYGKTVTTLQRQFKRREK